MGGREVCAQIDRTAHMLVSPSLTPEPRSVCLSPRVETVLPSIPTRRISWSPTATPSTSSSFCLTLRIVALGGAGTSRTENRTEQMHTCTATALFVFGVPPSCLPLLSSSHPQPHFYIVLRYRESRAGGGTHSGLSLSGTRRVDSVLTRRISRYVHPWPSRAISCELEKKVTDHLTEASMGWGPFVH